MIIFSGGVGSVGPEKSCVMAGPNSAYTLGRIRRFGGDLHRVGSPHRAMDNDIEADKRATLPMSLAAVFLDVDGVIDSRKVPCLEATKVERLRRAVTAVPDCVVVISSHWRLVPKQLTTLSTVLQYHGLHVIGVTPSLQPWEPKRPLEIAQWLETYNTGCRELGMPQVTAFVTVDDRDLVNEQGGAALCGRAVQTSRLAGLQESDADEITALLAAQRAGLDGRLPPVPGLAAFSSVRWVDESPESVVTLLNAMHAPCVPLPFVVQLVRYPPAARSGRDGAAPC